LTFDNVVLPQGDDVGVLVLWQPPDASGTEEARNRANHVFLAILQRFNAEGRKSSDAKTSIHYAPKVFAREREARDMCVGPALLEVAMQDLLAEGTIRGVEEGHGGKQHWSKGSGGPPCP
jgi:hypothetical protein